MSESATPAAPAPPRAAATVGAQRAIPDPYRVLFPIGAANAVAGSVLWTLSALGLLPWPGPLHRVLMIEGFEHAFVMGFLLTAMPAFIGGARCTRGELTRAVLSVLAVDLFAFAGLPAAAHLAFLFGLGTLAAALIPRVRHRRRKPPEEYLFLIPGFLCGAIGAVMLVGLDLGLWGEPQPHFAIRLLSLGMVLSLVLGIGSLLVPTFSGMASPLEIPGLAKAHERAPRRGLYIPLALSLIASFVLEAFDEVRAGAMLRAFVGAVIVLWVWKLWRTKILPGIPARLLWSSGWLLLAGLVIATFGPSWRLAGEHVVFVGGFGCVTFGVGTRVVSSHGRHPITSEGRVLDGWVALGLAAALALRVAAEWGGAHMVWLLGASGAAWALAWLAWLARALPLMVRPSNELLQVKVK
jgi:uncharacterized protein involved in response to NO